LLTNTFNSAVTLVLATMEAAPGVALGSAGLALFVVSVVVVVVAAGPVSVFEVSSLELSPVRANIGEAEAITKDNEQTTAPNRRCRFLRKVNSFEGSL
jgi:hypothetical protein